MKKLLSIVLAVAVLATMAFSMMAATASAAEAKTYSLLPTSADKFLEQEGSANGDGSITVTAEGDGFKFVADKGWPAAYTSDSQKTAIKDSEYWVATVSGSGSTLNYDFEVVSGSAKVVVYFCGQDPVGQSGLGSFFSINGYELPANFDKLTGDTPDDLPVGNYKKSIDIDSLGYADNLKGDNGEMHITGFKVFAVGGEVIVRDLSVTDKSGADNSHHKHPLDGNPTNPVVTTGANSGTSSTTATVAKTTAKAGTDSAKTGDTTNAIVFVAVAAVAAGAVVVTAKKQKAR